MNVEQVFEINKNNYEWLYSREEAFLRYPADWIIRFHNMFLKQNIPPGAKILDYGCGSANNSIFFLQKGYSVWGVDVAPSFINLVKKNFELHNIDIGKISNFKLVNSEIMHLEFPDDYFDFVLSNQVLYYLPSEEHLRKVCLEIKRVLRPDGIVFFTMLGTKNYYITHHLKQMYGNRIYEVMIEDPKHRLFGLHELILAIKDETDLCRLFDMFEPLTIGYFDQRMFDLYSNFHYIFVGKNNK